MSIDHMTTPIITAEQKQQFDRDGYLIARGLLSNKDVDELKETFMNMHAGGPIPGCFKPASPEEANGDVLKLYPRMMHPHRVNDVAFRYMIHSTIMDALAVLIEEEPLAAQSMFYFKPPGAKGQALHQDNFYLKVEPGTCIAAWVAVDPADEENGGLVIVPGSQNSVIQCPHEADPQYSFTREEVDVPEGLQVVPANMQAGDVLFFNGNVIHGSYPNQSTDRFRRAFICHYTGTSALRIAGGYKPLYDRHGRVADMETSTWTGPCGTEFDSSSPH